MARVVGLSVEVLREWLAGSFSVADMSLELDRLPGRPMRRSSAMKHTAALLSLLLAGCGMQPMTSVGARQCEADTDCVDVCSAFVEEVEHVGASAWQIDGWSCETTSVIPGPGPGPGCSCRVDDGSIPLTRATDEACLRFGRDRSCLYLRDEFPGCVVGDDASCEAPCRELQVRLDADAARTIDAETRSATCDAGHSCSCVTRIADGCYVGADLARYECSLSDAEIRAMHAELGAPYPPCSEVDPSGGGGTCIDDTPVDECRHPRGPEEWQGMLVETCLRATCDVSSRCGFAGACIDGLCGPCEADAECAAGEACVLDYCVLAANIGCRSRHDCPPDVLCTLSGLSDGPRGNADMISLCGVARPPRMD